MSERDAFLRAIADDPENDAPRLVFADWLDEHGEPEHAAYIRAAIDVERLPRSDPRHFEVRNRFARMKPPAGATAGLPDALRPHATLSRGFADGLKVGSSAFAGLGSAILDCPLPLHRVAFTEFHEPATVANCPALVRFRGIEIEGSLLGPQPGTPQASPHFGPVTRLVVPHPDLCGPIVRIITSDPEFENLRELTLNTGYRRDADAVGTLANSPKMGRLERLTVKLSDGWRSLARSPHLACLRNFGPASLHTGWLNPVLAGGLPGLRELGIFGRETPDSLWKRLFRSPRFRDLTALCLYDVPEEAWAEMPDDPGPPNLRLLLSRSSFESVSAFVRSPLLGRCIELHLWGESVTLSVLAALATSPHAQHLRYLSLGGTRPTGTFLPPETVRTLAESPYLAGLTALSLGGHSLGDDRLAMLAGATFAGGLRALAWSGSRVMPDTLRRLTTGTAFPKLCALEVGQSLEPVLARFLATRFDLKWTVNDSVSGIAPDTF